MVQQAHHALSYVELSVTDLAAARAFYGAAFGWEFNDYGPGYSGIRAADGEGEVGGLAASDAPGDNGTNNTTSDAASEVTSEVTNNAGPLVLLFSNDLDASLVAVTEAGGTIAAGPYDYPGGRRFEFFDPSGNRLGVFSEG